VGNMGNMGKMGDMRKQQGEVAGLLEVGAEATAKLAEWKPPLNELEAATLRQEPGRSWARTVRRSRDSGACWAEVGRAGPRWTGNGGRVQQLRGEIDEAQQQQQQQRSLCVVCLCACVIRWGPRRIGFRVGLGSWSLAERSTRILW
jgi:hypothetical protein